jgi:hypothetical protein
MSRRSVPSQPSFSPDKPPAPPQDGREDAAPTRGTLTPESNPAYVAGPGEGEAKGRGRGGAGRGKEGEGERWREAYVPYGDK